MIFNQSDFPNGIKKNRFGHVGLPSVALCEFPMGDYSVFLNAKEQCTELTQHSKHQDKLDGVSVELHVERFGKEDGANHTTLGRRKTWSEGINGGMNVFSEREEVYCNVSVPVRTTTARTLALP